MTKICGALLICFIIISSRAQEATLPPDFRQQNLTEYNSSILNPAYALDRNNPSSISLWSRWQWQTIDADPTSFFLNYTAKLNTSSAAGVAFFQHNTGIFINTGGALNYAYGIQLSPKVTLGVGLNVFGYQQKLADDRFFVPNPIQTTIPNDFILQLSPGLNLSIDKFNIGFTSENLFDYNFSTNERNTSSSDLILLGLASYDIPVGILNADSNSYLRPALYFKSIPGLDTQIGFTSLLTTSKFWVQGGYNSFYGISGGVGGRFFKRFSLGALIEMGTSADLDGQDPTFELVASYKIGKPETPEELEEQLLAEETKKEEKLKEELEKAEALALKKEVREQERLEKETIKRRKDSIQEANKNNSVAVKETKRDLKRKTDSINSIRQKEALADAKKLKEKQIQDSVALARKVEKEALASRLKKAEDSISQARLAEAEIVKKKAELERLAQQNEVVKPQAGEKYEEVAKQGSLEPGYYLIANVFGTKRYFEAFMGDLKKKGLTPGSFYRDINKFNYVYLERYNSIKDARQARDSKFNGKYTDKTWIFRVVGN